MRVDMHGCVRLSNTVLPRVDRQWKRIDKQYDNSLFVSI